LAERVRKVAGQRKNRRLRSGSGLFVTITLF
jgi:hypothetical protein